MNTLNEYIIHNLSLGYDLESIRESLGKAGYDSSQINSAIDYVMAHGGGQTNSDSKQIHAGHSHQNKKLIIIISAVFLVIVGLVAILLMQLSQGVSPEPAQPRLITQTQTTIPQETQNSDSTSGSETQTQSNTQTSQTTQQNQAQNQQPAGDASSSKFDPSTQTSPTFENRLSRLEIDETVEVIARGDPDEALKLCKQIIPRGGQNNCITKVAVDSENYRLCELIKDDPAKDTCYINFAINELVGSEVCRHIINEFKRSSCFDLYVTLAELERVQSNIPPVQEINQSMLEDGFTTAAFS